MITSATRDCPVISVAVPLLNGLPLAHVQAVAAGEAARQARARRLVLSGRRPVDISHESRLFRVEFETRPYTGVDVPDVKAMRPKTFLDGEDTDSWLS